MNGIVIILASLPAVTNALISIAIIGIIVIAWGIHGLTMRYQTVLRKYQEAKREYQDIHPIHFSYLGIDPNRGVRELENASKTAIEKCNSRIFIGLILVVDSGLRLLGSDFSLFNYPLQWICMWMCIGFLTWVLKGLIFRAFIRKTEPDIQLKPFFFM